MYYCGVCRSIGKHYGQIPRFGLVNETGMLAMVLDVICHTNKHVKTLKRGCIAHPHKKTLSVINNDSADYAADVNVLLIYHKLKDSWYDNKNLLSEAGSLILKKAYLKASEKQAKLSGIIERNLKKLSELEKTNCSSIDRAADPFSEIMRDIFSMYPKLDENKFAHAGQLGYNIGKWIYLIDALNDLDEDIKNKSYNCLLLKYDYSKEENIQDFKKRIWDDLLFSFEMCLSAAADSWDSLTNDLDDTPCNKDALNYMNNVIYVGMRHKTMIQLNNNDKVDEKNE